MERSNPPILCLASKAGVRVSEANAMAGRDADAPRVAKMRTVGQFANYPFPRVRMIPNHRPPKRGPRPINRQSVMNTPATLSEAPAAALFASIGVYSPFNFPKQTLTPRQIARPCSETAG